MMLSKEMKKKKRAANIEIPQNSNESTPLKKKKQKNKKTVRTNN